ncbi:Inorganic pyrophosphatase [Hondaea fermentalgiana]|uniref:inorganic diphosphatase n=1 Tax=Hondaea fermentalgiana TaxID=2315210 RepID=A0A2R5GBT2_9STRA|nr:Inorganic pyrophosphatase [Hondaea fermentalgiana]|eukprot:GBG28437.1 Inorganic pyrophosphatase [Hondaea fermentalgiana]
MQIARYRLGAHQRERHDGERTARGEALRPSGTRRCLAMSSKARDLQRGAVVAGVACLVLVGLVLSATPGDEAQVRLRDGLVDLHPVAVELSAIEMAAQEQEAETAALELPPFPDFAPGTVYVGHMTPDADSITSAVAAAYLFNGKAMRAGNINRETQFLLDFFAVPTPDLVDEAYKGEDFVLVDHNAFAQRAKALDAAKIQGIFDHHAISTTPTLVVKPIYVNVRPWGSCATVIATKYLEYKRPLPPRIAGMLMGGIISDTLNLKSPTTTEWDERVLHWLASKLHWASSNGSRVLGSKLPEHDLRKAVRRFAHRQFQAKANTTGMPLQQVALADFKSYYLQSPHDNGRKLVLGWGTIETVEPFYERYLREHVLQELVLEVMPRILQKRDLEAVYLSIVDIEEDRSVVLCSARRDCDLLEQAFPDAEREGIARAVHAASFTTSPRVSRKKEFIPPIRGVLQGDHKKAHSSSSSSSGRGSM